MLVLVTSSLHVRCIDQPNAAQAVRFNDHLIAEEHEQAEKARREDDLRGFSKCLKSRNFYKYYKFRKYSTEIQKVSVAKNFQWAHI